MNDLPTLTERAKFYLDRSNVEPRTDFGIICQGVIDLERERDEAREQNAALRDALRVRVMQGDVTRNAKPCPECEWYTGHSKTCRHYQTESEVMQ